MLIDPVNVFHSSHISHEHDHVYFNFRTCGIAIHNNRVLIVKIAPYNFWLFPGGRVEYLESSKDALKREIKEELGINCCVARLLWAVEDFYSFENQKTHELGYYYLIEFPENSEIYSKQEEWTFSENAREHEEAKTLSFMWVPIQDLDKVELIPDYIKERLCNLPKEPQFLIINNLK